MFVLDLATVLVVAALVAAVFYAGRVDPLRRWAVAGAYVVALAFALVLASAWGHPHPGRLRIPPGAYFFVPVIAAVLLSLRRRRSRPEPPARTRWHASHDAHRAEVIVFFSAVSLIYAILLALLYV